MSFKIPKKTALIDFDDGEFDGCEVRCTLDVSFEQFFQYQRLASAQDIDALSDTLRQFGDQIVKEWNLVDDKDQPIPVSGESLLAQPVGFGTALLKAWLKGMTMPSAPLEAPSSGGAASEADTTPKETA